MLRVDEPLRWGKGCGCRWGFQSGAGCKLYMVYRNTVKSKLVITVLPLNLGCVIIMGFSATHQPVLGG